MKAPLKVEGCEGQQIIQDHSTPGWMGKCQPGKCPETSIYVRTGDKTSHPGHGVVMLLLAAEMLQLVKPSWNDSQDRSDMPGISPSIPQKVYFPPPPLPQDLTFFFPNSSCFCSVYICSVLSIARAPSLQLLTS